MFTRPKQDDSEDELLHMQDDLLLGHGAPATTAIRCEKRKSQSSREGIQGKRVTFADTLAGDTQIYKKRRSSEKMPKDASTFDTAKPTEHPSCIVMADVLEKSFDYSAGEVPMPTNTMGTDSFPDILDGTQGASCSSHMDPPKRSLFSRQMEKIRSGTSSTNNKYEEEMDMDPVEDKQATLQQMYGNSSVIVDGSGIGERDAEISIHMENLQKLASMTEEEIEEQRQQVMAALTPKLLQFIKARRNKGRSSASTTVSLPIEPDNSVNMPTISKLDLLPDVMNIPPSHVDDTEYPLHLTSVRQYPHMDIVEKEKLQWMSNLPKPQPMDPSTGYSARFNFEGDLLPYISDIPVMLGLHHHGDESGRAGYTCEELVLLMRSSNIQQRHIALTTLSNIIKKSKEGLYDTAFSSPLVPTLMDSGLLLLLRFALDDPVEAVHSAAAQAICQLITTAADEVCLDRVLPWHRGWEQPDMSVKQTAESDTTSADEVEEMKDHLVMQEDAIKGLIRVDILPRIRYILDVLKSSSPITTSSLLSILIRMVRHSYEVANHILLFPHLLSVIFSRFLSRIWIPTPTESPDVVHVGTPVCEALKLMRILSTWGCDMADVLINKYKLTDVLLSFATMVPSETGPYPVPQTLRLCIESLHTWRTLLIYGKTPNTFISVYPVLMQWIQYYQTKINVDENETANQFNYDAGAALFSLLETVLNIAAVRPSDIGRFNNNKGNAFYPVLNSSHVIGLLDLIEECTNKWLFQLARINYVPSYSALQMVACVMDIQATFYEKFESLCPEIKVASYSDRPVKLFGLKIRHVITSVMWRKLLDQLRLHSILLSDTFVSGTLRDPPSLPSLGVLTYGHEHSVTPLLKDTSPFKFVMSTIGFVRSLAVKDETLVGELSYCIMKSPVLVDYVTDVGNIRMTPNFNHWFTRYELQLVHLMLKVAVMKLPMDPVPFHKMALVFVSCSDDEYLIQDVFKTVIFVQGFIPECNDLSESLSLLSVDLNPGSDIPKTPLLSKDVWSRLPVMEMIYCKAALNKTEVDRCYNMEKRLPHRITSLVMKNSGPALPHDWLYMPIISIYNAFNSSKSSVTIDESDISPVTVLQCWLQWLYIVHLWRPTIAKSISSTCKYCRLGCVFLAGNDLFLDPTVYSYLLAITQIFLQTEGHLIDFSSTVHGLTSFADFYVLLLRQYEGVSYGNWLFCMYILLPLQQRHPVGLRLLVWGEHSAAIRVANITEKQLLVPMNTFLNPIETNEPLIIKYFQDLISGSVREAWSPVLFRVAVHHIASYIHNCVSPLQQSIKSKALQIADQILKDLLIPPANEFHHD